MVWSVADCGPVCPLFVCAAYMANPAHIELVLTEASEVVEKAAEAKAPRKLSGKEVAKKRLANGGGVSA